MPYWQLYYHIVTATKNREPLITPKIEPVLYRLILAKARDLECKVYALNGTADHVHLIVSIPPRLAVAQFIGQIKGYSSAQLHQLKSEYSTFNWQAEYSVHSFDHKRIPPCIEYVKNQKIHHRTQTNLYEILERCEEIQQHIQEAPALYQTNLPGEGEWDLLEPVDDSLPW